VVLLEEVSIGKTQRGVRAVTSGVLANIEVPDVGFGTVIVHRWYGLLVVVGLACIRGGKVYFLPTVNDSGFF
jgi:hypothetical protein